MLSKKSDKGNLENKRMLFVLVGLVAVLALVYAGFELFASTNHAISFNQMDDFFTEVSDEDVLATDKTPPPPPVAPQQPKEFIIHVVDDNIQTTDELLFIQDFTEMDAIPDLIDETPIEIIDEKSDPEPPEHFTETMPEFPGGPEALNAFLSKSIQYPEIARNNGITGTVLVEFIVEKDGSVSNAKVKVPLFPECDKEAVRGIMTMPKWSPGKNMGKAVRCYYQVPVTFKMN